MIIEKRKRIRLIKPNECNWASEFNLRESRDCEDEPVCKNETVPWQTVLAFAVITGFSAYAIGSYLICS